MHRPGCPTSFIAGIIYLCRPVRHRHFAKMTNCRNCIYFSGKAHKFFPRCLSTKAIIKTSVREINSYTKYYPI